MYDQAVRARDELAVNAGPLAEAFDHEEITCMMLEGKCCDWTSHVQQIDMQAREHLSYAADVDLQLRGRRVQHQQADVQLSEAQACVVDLDAQFREATAATFAASLEARCRHHGEMTVNGRLTAAERAALLRHSGRKPP